MCWIGRCSSGYASISEFLSEASSRGTVHFFCLCPPNPWWEHSYCTLQQNFKVKNSCFLFSPFYCYHCSFTSLINYALFALLKLSGFFWVLCFLIFFSFYCFRSLCMVHDSECYLWGFDLLPYSLKSSRSIYEFCFALSEPQFPCKWI